jgi:hypothetical protein
MAQQKQRSRTVAVTVLSALMTASLGVLVAQPAAGASGDVPDLPLTQVDPSWVSSSGEGWRVSSEPTPIDANGARTLAEDDEECSAVADDGTWTCLRTLDQDLKELPSLESGAADFDPYPIPEWCTEHGASGVTYVTRHNGCVISSHVFTVYQTRDGVTTVVGLMNFLVADYIVTSPDTNFWHHQVTVAPSILTGEAVGVEVAGVPLCASGPCVEEDVDFVPEALTTVGDEVSGLATWEWPVVAGGQGTSNTGWSLSFRAPTAQEWVSGQFGNAADIRCDSELINRVAGCVIPFATPTMTWAYWEFPEYGDHLIDAINSGLPGANLGAGSVPLHRLMDDALQQANRNLACPDSYPRPTGKSCDEYPFASTYEGASTGGGTGRTFDWCGISQLPTGVTGPTGYSSCMIDETNNSGAGGQLETRLYGPERVLDGDAFWVNFSG